ncbi:uncharacterized protein [Ciconia boyciana]|uniref:uncharacterized protein n=1 Tax=Ciconia boyciana TaxID=52775 RepID=UPI003BA3AC60
MSRVTQAPPERRKKRKRTLGKTPSRTTPTSGISHRAEPLFPPMGTPLARAQPRQVNGVLGGSVLLSPALPPNKTVKEIEWSFSAGAGATIQVAEFGPRGFERPDPKDRFKDRLEMFNETALKIGALERGDGGVYGARIKLHPALVEDQSFSLSVYDGWLQSGDADYRNSLISALNASVRGPSASAARMFPALGTDSPPCPPPSVCAK